MATTLHKAIVRKLDGVWIQGKNPVVRIRPDRVDIKLQGEHWNSSGYEIPWTRIFLIGAQIKAHEKQKERKIRRLAKRGLIR